jgi:ABC-type nitrate/sulfonate/bicarbonate transport system substrate-binding protein
MKKIGFALIVAASFISVVLTHHNALAKSYLAYISQSADTSAPYWVAQDAGFFKKHGLDIELVFISSSVMATQSLMAGDIQFASAGGTAAVNGKLAGGDIAIINSLGNTLPYYIIGKPEIKSPEDMRGRSAAVHLPGTAADLHFASDSKPPASVSRTSRPSWSEALHQGSRPLKPANWILLWSRGPEKLREKKPG